VATGIDEWMTPRLLTYSCLCAGIRLSLLAGGLAMSVTPMRKHEPAKAQDSMYPWFALAGTDTKWRIDPRRGAVGSYIYKLYYANPRTDDAYVHANTAALAAHAAGKSSICRSRTTST